jgi:DJ-1/PfpI family
VITIAVAFFDAVEELDFAGPWEVLSVWARTWTGDEVAVFTVAESNEPLTCAKGLRVLPERTWQSVDDVDVLVYPGGRGVMSQLGDERIRARLRRLAEKGTPPPGGPKVDSGEWKLGFGGQPFTPLEEGSYEHEMETDRDGVAAYYVSTSSTAQLPPAERAALRAELVDALADVPYRLLLTARVFTTRKVADRL